jgi:hypothetical protein
MLRASWCSVLLRGRRPLNIYLHCVRVALRSPSAWRSATLHTTTADASPLPDDLSEGSVCNDDYDADGYLSMSKCDAVQRPAKSLVPTRNYTTINYSIINTPPFIFERERVCVCVSRRGRARG